MNISTISEDQGLVDESYIKHNVDGLGDEEI